MTLTGLRRIRKSKKISRGELAKASGLNINTIADLETKEASNVKLSTLVALAKTLKCKVRDFFEVEDKKCL